MLPAPNLDDRRFQDLVDDAKRLIALNCPEWTDHNVSDPGVTLVEAFAFMADELFYRLNRVPDRLYVKFLDLLGVTLHPPAAATTELTMWLSAPQPNPVVIKAGTEASTRRTPDEESIVFASTKDLVIPPRTLAHLATQAAGAEPRLQPSALRGDEDLTAFSPSPAVGDVLLIGLDDAVPSCAVALRFDCEVSGVGVDPLHPPLVWEAWDGSQWLRADIVSDQTGGLNQPGDIVLLVTEDHAASVIGGARAGWLRCRVVEPPPDYPFYRSSPHIRSVSAFTTGGTVPGIHAETTQDEVLGLSEGVPGQEFPLDRSPVLADGRPFVVEVGTGSGWDEWTEVDSFAGSGPEDQVVRLDRAEGLVLFPPAVREADGTFTHYGAVPRKGCPLRVRAYRVGGGPRGNVSARAVSVLRTTIPFVLRVENRRAAHGGVSGETIEEAKNRGPIALRSRDRAVTAEDYEELARRVSAGIARVRCIPATTSADAGGVRLLVVPAAAEDESGRLRFEDLVPDEEMLARVAAELEHRRPIGARVVVEPPFYRGLTVVARVAVMPRGSVEEVEHEAIAALYRHFNPISGGPGGRGWPFGRPVNAGEAYSVLQRVPGIDTVDDVLLFAADPITGERGEPVQKLVLDPHALVFSFEHRVRVRKGG